MIKAYCDGSCYGNGSSDAKGGFGVVILDGNKPMNVISGCLSRTNTPTNQRSEIAAAIAALSYLYPTWDNVEIITDSQLVVETYKSNWKRKSNHDLWLKLDNLVYGMNVTFSWIKGHDGNPHQEKANTLAMTGAQFNQHCWKSLGSGIHLCVCCNLVARENLPNYDQVLSSNCTGL